MYVSTNNVDFDRILVGVVTNHQLSGLTGGQQYYVKVAAINAVGEGTASDVTGGNPTSSTSTTEPGDVLGPTVAIVTIGAVGGGVALLFFLDKRGIVTLRKPGRA